MYEHVTEKFVDSILLPEDLQKVLLTYDHLALGRRRSDNAIVAMTVVRAEIDVIDGKRYNLIKAGLAYVDKEYQNGVFFPAVRAYFSLKELMLFPDIPLYHVAKCYSYKGYLTAIAMKHGKAYPTYDKATPEWEKKMIIKYGRKYETNFNEETFVVKCNHTKVQENSAILSDKNKANPHINFYCSQNPEWIKGHSLITIAHCTWNDVGNLLKKATMKSQYLQQASLKSNL
ncbi:uncharacterized protein [Dysidea avara]|uniref:uncharacterized protein n=1 Tax=Dysidea avara TaxID=196820 RepID=UPI003322B868